ncbi:hypothetical protein ACFSO0_12555 [Brevibacillus sp. GCM10020057]|uniref:hypothetical protein n=1 Tax=Brevibacillus sp. GCM10020057 TaxID=3317327 RepID=UPI003642C05B
MNKSIVVSDTDVLVHIIHGNIFRVLVPAVIEEIYIPPKVEEELKLRGVHTQLFYYLNEGNWVKRTADKWASMSDHDRKELQRVKKEMRAVLDPGELECYAYSVGLGIDGIISDDGDARKKISEETNGKKIVLNFAQLLLLGVKLDKFSLSEAEQYFQNVIRANRLHNFNPFPQQVQIFDSITIQHPWVQQFL